MGQTITIKRGDASSGDLTLNPSGTVSVKKNEEVQWVVASSATNVASFRIAPKSGSKDIFEQGHKPPSQHTRDGKGKVKADAGDHDVYDYSIFWKIHPDDGDELECDPKLAVMPSNSFDFLWLVGGLALTGLGVFALQRWRRKRRKKAWFGR